MRQILGEMLVFNQTVSKNTLSGLLMASAYLSILASLSGCGMFGTKHDKGESASVTAGTPEEEAARRSGDSQGVRQQLTEAANSVDSNLQELMTVERGPKAGQVNDSSVPGSTITASHNNDDDSVLNSSGANSAPHSDMGAAGTDPATKNYAGKAQDDEDEHNGDRHAQAISDLRSTVKIRWKGRPDLLLSKLSKKIDFSFGIVGVGALPEISIPEEQVSVAKVLRQVADQIDATADLSVSTNARSITLVYHPGR